MKRLFLILALCAVNLFGWAQKASEDDIKQFYRTLQGDYIGQLNDSVTVSLHLTPIWEQNRFQWLYLEAVDNGTQQVLEQKILEIKPLKQTTFKVIVHGIRQPETFAGKWSNRNFFDGYNTHILKGKGTFLFMKTKDFDYQTNWNGRKLLKCFPKRDRVHFKCSQEDERIWVKRVPAGTSNIKGIVFFKDPTD